MVSNRRHWLLSLLLISEVVLLGTLSPDGGEAMILQHRGQVAWKIFTAPDLVSGVLIPSDLNVVFTVPSDVQSIGRETLLGHQGQSVRYWGYCFSQDASAPATHGLFPGKLFLSEAERNARAKAQSSAAPSYSLQNLPTQQQLDKDAEKTVNGAVRHQVEYFTAGQTCYIMSAKQLYVGSDADNDGLNSAEEKKAGTDPLVTDTDGDGMLDGLEVLNFKTNPRNPDTDRDGLADGEEVHGHTRVVPSHYTGDGTYVEGDTDPKNPDTDHDGLCDGYCAMDVSGTFCGTLYGGTGSGSFKCLGTGYNDSANTLRWSGENAKDLSGGTDNWETDPTKWSTKGDDISDYELYYKQLLNGQTPTP